MVENRESSAKQNIHFHCFMSDALVPATRHRHTVNGRLAYEWCQYLDDVLIVVPDVPPAPARAFCVSIQATRLTLGLVNNPPYLDVSGDGVGVWDLQLPSQGAGWTRVCVAAAGRLQSRSRSNGPFLPTRAPLPLPLLPSPQLDLAGRVKPSESVWTLGECRVWWSAGGVCVGASRKQHAATRASPADLPSPPTHSTRGRPTARLPHQSRPGRTLARRLCRARARDWGAPPRRGPPAARTVPGGTPRP